MSDPSVTIKSSKTSLPETSENGETTRSSPVHVISPSSPAIKTSQPDSLNTNSSFLRRHLSRKFSRSSSQRSDANIEAIILEETVGKKRQPVTLKASFLRRKIEEYEGKKRHCNDSALKVVHFFVISNWGSKLICERLCRHNSFGCESLDMRCCDEQFNVM
jgi:hypothetical protein